MGSTRSTGAMQSVGGRVIVRPRQAKRRKKGTYDGRGPVFVYVAAAGMAQLPSEMYGGGDVESAYGNTAGDFGTYFPSETDPRNVDTEIRDGDILPSTEQPCSCFQNGINDFFNGVDQASDTNYTGSCSVQTLGIVLGIMAAVIVGLVIFVAYKMRCFGTCCGLKMPCGKRGDAKGGISLENLNLMTTDSEYGVWVTTPEGTRVLATLHEKQQ